MRLYPRFKLQTHIRVEQDLPQAVRRSGDLGRHGA